MCRLTCLRKIGVSCKPGMENNLFKLIVIRHFSLVLNAIHLICNGFLKSEQVSDYVASRFRPNSKPRLRVLIITFDPQKPEDPIMMSYRLTYSHTLILQ